MSRSHSYSPRSDRLFFIDNMLRIEGLPKGEMIYTKWHSGYSKYSIKYRDPVISKDNTGQYWITFAILVEKPIKYFEEKNISSLGRAIGIDLNVDNRIVLSTGEIYKAPELNKLYKKLVRYDRKCTKDLIRQKMNDISISNRANKRILKRNKVYRKITNINKNFVEKTTKDIINKYPSAIVMESLNILDMRKNKMISKLIHYCNFSNIKRRMSEKCNKYNIPFKLADRYFPSSQICSNCGHKLKWHKDYHKYICPICGLVIDRDLNSAINLENLAYNC